jgi:hypothetical protein
MNDEKFSTESRNLHTTLNRVTLKIDDLEIVVTEEATKAANTLTISIKDVFNPSQTSSQIIFFNDRINFSSCLSFIDNLISQYTETSDYTQKELKQKTTITSTLPDTDEFTEVTHSKRHSYVPRLYIIVNNTVDGLDNDHVINIFDEVIEIKDTGVAKQTDEVIIETDSISIKSLHGVTKILGIIPSDITLAAKVIEESRKAIAPSK